MNPRVSSSGHIMIKILSRSQTMMKRHTTSTFCIVVYPDHGRHNNGMDGDWKRTLFTFYLPTVLDFKLDVLNPVVKCVTWKSTAVRWPREGRGGMVVNVKLFNKHPWPQNKSISILIISYQRNVTATVNRFEPRNNYKLMFIAMGHKWTICHWTSFIWWWLWNSRQNK